MMRAEENDLLLLRALCQITDRALLRHACRALRRHRWALGEHQVIYESCAALASRSARIESCSLASEATRAGFPDVDLDALFVPLAAPDRELLRALAATEREQR